MKQKYMKAFTLIEVVVAIGVFAIGVLAIVAFFANSATLTRMASNKSVASNLAQGYIDDELAKSYDGSTVGQTAKVRVTNDPQSSLYNFYEQETISLIDVNLNQVANDLGLKKIQVAISYQEGGQNKNVTLTTIKVKK